MASGSIVGMLRDMTQPSANAASPDIRAGGSAAPEQVPVYDFDDTIIEYVDFYGRLEGYAGGGLTLTFDWSATDTTVAPHSVAWEAGFRRIQDDAEDIDASHSYDFNTVIDQEPSASGESSRATITFADGADMDSLANGEAFILRLRRDPSNGSDNLTGDAELWPWTVALKET